MTFPWSLRSGAALLLLPLGMSTAGEGAPKGWAGAAGSGPISLGMAAQPLERAPDAERMESSFYFTRGAYSGWGRSWATDAPEADRWIASVIQRLTFIDISPRENFVALDDPELRRFPFVYLLEVGDMALSDTEAAGLRDYLLRGGFAMVDDFWGTREWENWEREIRRVLPEFEIIDIPLDHEIFSTMYLVDEVVQVPSVSGARSGVTSQRDGIVPYVRGIFDDDGRLMVVINWNTDIGDAWEWAEAPYYPLQYSTYAYQVAANTFVYAMTH